MTIILEFLYGIEDKPLLSQQDFNTLKSLLDNATVEDIDIIFECGYLSWDLLFDSKDLNNMKNDAILEHMFKLLRDNVLPTPYYARKLKTYNLITSQEMSKIWEYTIINSKHINTNDIIFYINECPEYVNKEIIEKGLLKVLKTHLEEIDLKDLLFMITHWSECNTNIECPNVDISVFKEAASRIGFIIVKTIGGEYKCMDKHKYESDMIVGKYQEYLKDLGPQTILEELTVYSMWCITEMVVKNLIENGLNINIFGNYRSQRSTILTCLCGFRFEKRMISILKHGADPNLRDDTDISPIESVLMGLDGNCMRQIFRREVENCIKVLIKYGATLTISKNVKDECLYVYHSEYLNGLSWKIKD
jgi:hypothetical protein